MKLRFLRGLTVLALFYIVMTIAVVLTAHDANTRSTKTNYEMQAQCIAEYDYQHPERTMMANLEAALEVCR